MVGSIIIDPL